jgi:hypothetical protein
MAGQWSGGQIGVRALFRATSSPKRLILVVVNKKWSIAEAQKRPFPAPTPRLPPTISAHIPHCSLCRCRVRAAGWSSESIDVFFGECASLRHQFAYIQAGAPPRLVISRSPERPLHHRPSPTNTNRLAALCDACLAGFRLIAAAHTCDRHELLALTADTTGRPFDDGTFAAAPVLDSLERLVDALK